MAGLGTCAYCGHQMAYASPPPVVPVTDMRHFYQRSFSWYDATLIDTPLVFGRFCPFAPAHPLGQSAVHLLVPAVIYQ